MELAFRWEEAPAPGTIERFRAAAERQLALVRSVVARDTVTPI